MINVIYKETHNYTAGTPNNGNTQKNIKVENNFCDLPLPKYLDSKTVLIYCPHPVFPEKF